MSEMLPPIIARLTADVAEFKAAMLEAAHSEEQMVSRGTKGASDLEKAHDDLDKKSAGFAGHMQSLFGSLGSTMGNWGIPFGESVSKMGDKIGEAETKGKGFGQALSEVGKVAAVGMGVGLAAAAGESIHLAENFQQSTASLAAHAGITTQAAQQIGKAFLSTAGQTTFSAQEMESAFAPVAGQFQTMYGHTLNAAQSLTFMKAAMDAAEASGVPLADTTKTLASAMMVYHLNVGQASDASDVMWNTSKSLGVSITDLGSSLSRLEPRIAGSGMSIQQTGAFMVELAKEAGNGRQAMRLAGTAIQSMISPSTSAQKALETMGVSLTDSSGKFVGMRAAVGALHDAFAKLPGAQASVAAGQQLVNAQEDLAKLKTETQTKAVKAQEATLTAHIGVLKLQASQLSTNSAMQAVFGRNANLMASMVAGGVPAFDAATKAVSAQGTAQKAAELQASTFKGTMEKLKATGEDLGVKFGELLIPVITRLGEIIASVTNFFIQHRTAAVALGIVVGGFLVAAVAAYTVSMIAAAAATIAATWPVLAIIAAVALLAAGIYELVTHFKAVVSFLHGPWGTAISAAIAVMDPFIGIPMLIIGHWQMLLNFFKRAWADIKQWTMDGVHFVIAHWQLLLAGVLAVVLGPFAAIPLLVWKYWSQISQFTANMWHDVVGIFERLPGDVMNAVGSLLGDLERFGENIVHAIVRGIGNIGSDIGNAIKGAVSHIPGVSAAEHLLHIGAAGGFIDKPTLLLAGEAGPEVLLPLTNPARMTALMSSIATPLPSNGGIPAAASPGGMLSSPSQPTFYNNVTVQSQADPSALAREIAWEMRQLVAGKVNGF
jgi:TP901 family phage tail tape measure protein